jgi:hypothetical protein
VAKNAKRLSFTYLLDLVYLMLLSYLPLFLSQIREKSLISDHYAVLHQPANAQTCWPQGNQLREGHWMTKKTSKRAWTYIHTIPYHTYQYHHYQTTLYHTYHTILYRTVPYHVIHTIHTYHTYHTCHTCHTWHTWHTLHTIPYLTIPYLNIQ